MDRGDFTADAPGELVDIVANGYETVAFVPHDLDTIHLDQGAFTNEIGQAMRMLGALEYIGPKAGSNTMLVEAFARKEAVQSSRIEGTQVTLADMYRYEARQTVGERTADTEGARQAKNYLDALRRGLKLLSARGEITTEALCEMQAILLDGVRSEDPAPGEIRHTQNYIAPFEDAAISRATFVPPPPEQARTKLERLLEYTNSRHAVHSLVKLGLIHYQFETIHPFRDGNGRLGRVLISLELQREELLSKPYLYLSAFFNEYRSDYTRLLTEVRTRGNWDDWLHFVLRGIWKQAAEAVERGERLMELRTEYTETYQRHRSPFIVPLAHKLFENPYITAKEAEQRLGCSHTTAYSLIETLEADGVLVEVGGDGESRLYEATEIFTLLDDPLSEL